MKIRYVIVIRWHGYAVRNALIRNPELATCAVFLSPYIGWPKYLNIVPVRNINVLNIAKSVRYPKRRHFNKRFLYTIFHIGSKIIGTTTFWPLPIVHTFQQISKGETLPENRLHILKVCSTFYGFKKQTDILRVLFHQRKLCTSKGVQSFHWRCLKQGNSKGNFTNKENIAHSQGDLIVKFEFKIDSGMSCASASKK